ncbi:C40 family peptidase [Saccharopolyspora phatthalungensis]|uniref:Cell wall-associated NlpC family hydrolase n=1 Tax=Saccharopolyspora phatthalungensis TaxID=664693 RepID=A0A840QG07_9PSEU|nr:NlpC/P60 family protein [Saccharopolyspora phatthalungensis]MBB5157425.1 cell wall-associated NlpC family hydrolase [Saccharopolyspora phatthalungensis]
MTKLMVAVLGVIIGFPLFLAFAVTGAFSALSGNSSSADAACIPTGATSEGVAGYGPEQMANAATIVAVGKKMNVPEEGWVIAIATALQESGLRNLDHGDRDSLGLFQQRPSQGWGTPTQITDPTYAATQFYRHLLALPGWQDMSVNDAAQAVQQSGLPYAYAQHEPAARTVVAAVSGATCTTPETGDCDNIQAPNPTALAAINYACGQQGLPYVQGGNGPEAGHAGFDCSGLTTAAYQAAGISLPRKAQWQYDAGPLLPADASLQPGDLVFYGTPHNIHHVGLYIGAGQMINTPDFGQPVQVNNIRWPGDDYAGATRPTN